MNLGSYPFSDSDNSLSRTVCSWSTKFENKLNILCITPIDHLTNTKKY